MYIPTPLTNVLLKNATSFHYVVSFNPVSEKIITLDFTEHNQTLAQLDLQDTDALANYINLQLQGAKYGIGGYLENRILYRQSSLFDGAESRSIHLGIDIWGAVGTTIFAPLAGTVHSVAYNNNLGDYGATIILQHQLADIIFYTLYGHLSLYDIALLKEGDTIEKGAVFAHLGNLQENGHWPPHLHFQIMENMEGKKGDYPGVCTPSEKNRYAQNCPNADLILQLMQFAT
jgi:peptidoglycan LD-endopeptidase LytH